MTTRTTNILSLKYTQTHLSLHRAGSLNPREGPLGDLEERLKFVRPGNTKRGRRAWSRACMSTSERECFSKLSMPTWGTPRELPDSDATQPLPLVLVLPPQPPLKSVVDHPSLMPPISNTQPSPPPLPVPPQPSSATPPSRRPPRPCGVPSASRG